MNEKLVKLHLGCGEKYLEGYTNIDYPSDQHSVMKVKADTYTDLRALSYPEASVNEIRNHHVFEHFNRAEALKMLCRWRKWLKVGGVLHIETPDFERSAAKFLMAGRKGQAELGRHIFGSQEAPWADHLDFWYAAKFRYVFSKFGFTKIKVRRYSNSVSQRKFPRLRLLMNVLGDLLPRSLYVKYGGHKLPNIEVTAVKSDAVIDERAVAREILGMHLVGREADAMLEVWMKDFNS